jgi:SAM-dependent methyltransferase
VERLKSYVPPPVKRALNRIGISPRSRAPSDQGTADRLWHRQAVGGLWEEVGRLQFEYLVAQGLQPNDFLLDIGCGSLRGGVHFVRYLDTGHYWGVDIDERLLEAGRGELEQLGLAGKRPVLVQMADFRFSTLGREFDLALAQSVFTHLPLNSIIRCLMEVERVLAPGGRLYATIFENPAGKQELGAIEHRTADGSLIVSHLDRDPFHYDVDTFRWICDGTRLEVEYIGGWNHPRDQRMLLFRKR